MGIDRIGRGGGAGGASGPEGPGGVAPSKGTGQAFEVKRSDRPAASQAAIPVAGAQGTTPLEKLRAGQIDVPTYMDAKVEEATAHLQGLRPADLDALKRMLRDQLATDPALVDLLRGATGQSPPVPEE